jgi:hypothetical protein
VKVAEDLATLATLSLLWEARVHLPDLTHLTIWPRSCHHLRHRHLLPELASKARTSPRRLQPVHVPPLGQDPLLIPSATRPAAADHRSHLGEHPLCQTLAGDVLFARVQQEMTTTANSRRSPSNRAARGSSYPFGHSWARRGGNFRPSRPRSGRAWPDPACLSFFLFFFFLCINQILIVCCTLNQSKIVLSLRKL